MVKSMYDEEGCGICKKLGADVFWFSPHSRCTHQACYNLIKNAQKDLRTNLEYFFQNDYGNQNMAHVEAVESVEKEIHKKGLNTIKEYIEKHGESSLKSLFDSEGLRAVIQYKRTKKNNL